MEISRRDVAKTTVLVCKTTVLVLRMCARVVFGEKNVSESSPSSIGGARRYAYGI